MKVWALVYNDGQQGELLGLFFNKADARPAFEAKAKTMTSEHYNTEFDMDAEGSVWVTLGYGESLELSPVEVTGKPELTA